MAPVRYIKGEDTLRMMFAYIGEAFETPEDALRYAEEEDIFRCNPEAPIYEISAYCTQGGDPV